MQITVPSLEDAHAIATVHIRSWQKAYTDILSPEFLQSLSIEDRAERWREIMAANESITVVARDAGQLIAFASYGRCRDDGAPNDHGEIWGLYTLPTF